MMNPPYRLPAEWESHQATLICWPHEKKDWPGKFTPIPWVYTEIIRHLVTGENVLILIQSSSDRQKVLSHLKSAHVSMDSIEFLVKETDRGWMRDISPAFVCSDDTVHAVRFNFNGWAKYSNYHKDNTVPDVLSPKLKIGMKLALHESRKIVLEGGAIEANGRGTLVATEECLLDPDTQSRNPGFSKADYETVFKRYLGIGHVIWLGKGIAGDDTHGHIDDLCRFVNPDTLLLCREKNRKDENYHPLEENRERLRYAVLDNGSKPGIIDLPMPAPVYFRGMRLPASYANFYITNDSVLVPTFNDPNDRIALGIITECFPDRIITGIHSVDLVWGLGTIHCLTHEVPAPAC